MASLRKKPGTPYWFACFTLADGRRVQRSTKERTRKAAQAKADEWHRLSAERAKARQMQGVIASIYKAAHQRELPESTPRAFFTTWLDRRKGEVAPSSFAAYAGRAKHFVAWLQQQADRPMAELETRHFVQYRDALAQRLSASTANQGIKILRFMLEDARRDHLIAENPAKDCGLLRKAAAKMRRPFSVAELRSVLEVADAEWRSMILFGLYTGQRLADIATLDWSNVDLAAGEIQLRTAKTGRVVRVPINRPLQEHIEQLPAGDSPKAPLHPRAFAHAQVNSSTLSRQFGEILAAAGLASAKSHSGDSEKVKGRGARRTASELSFHSLRHTATSLMKNAGVSPAVVQDIIGHDSAEISAHYTHIESAAKRDALNRMPDLVAIG